MRIETRSSSSSRSTACRVSIGTLSGMNSSSILRFASARARVGERGELVEQLAQAAPGEEPAEVRLDDLEQVRRHHLGRRDDREAHQRRLLLQRRRDPAGRARRRPARRPSALPAPGVLVGQQHQHLVGLDAAARHLDPLDADRVAAGRRAPGLSVSRISGQDQPELGGDVVAHVEDAGVEPGRLVHHHRHEVRARTPCGSRRRRAGRRATFAGVRPRAAAWPAASASRAAAAARSQAAPREAAGADHERARTAGRGRRRRAPSAPRRWRAPSDSRRAGGSAPGRSSRRARPWRAASRWRSR